MLILSIATTGFLPRPAIIILPALWQDSAFRRQSVELRFGSKVRVSLTWLDYPCSALLCLTLLQSLSEQLYDPAHLLKRKSL
jgi:hypothetical protein